MSAEGELFVYQLEGRDLAEALATLLERTLQRGWRALVRSGDPARLPDLDLRLWTYRDDAFLPHGLSDEPHAEAQPVLLTSGTENLNRAEALFLVAGADPPPKAAFQRTCVLFDPSETEGRAKARALWRAARASGRPARYFRETATGWEEPDPG